MQSLHTCSSSRARWLTGFVALLSMTSACALTGIDPDEIDIADDGADEVGQDDGTETGVDSAGEATGENDQDTSGEATSGDTSGDTSGTTGADDSGDFVCEAVDELSLGDNAVEAPMASSLLEGECGGSGGESVFSFTAAVAGDHSFAVTAGEIPAVIYALDTQCTPLAGACAVDAAGFVASLDADETVFIVVDSDGAGGVVTLTITGP